MERHRSTRLACVWARSLRVLFIVVLLGLGMAISGRAQELPFVHYTPEGGAHPLPSASISLVYQDRLGFMWFSAFSSGLVRYDGQTTTLYTQEDGLLDLGVQSLAEDAQGRVWASSRAGVVASASPLQAYTAGRRIRFTRHVGTTPLTQSSVRARAMAVDNLGRMWVGTREEGLLRYDTKSLDSLRVDTLHVPRMATTRGREILSVAAGRDGTMWVGLGDGTILRYDENGRATVTGTQKAFQDSYPTSLYQGSGGALWVGTGSGRVFRASAPNTRGEFQQVGTLLRGGITDIRGTADSTVWVASEGDGVLHLDVRGAIIGHYTRASGLLNDNVKGTLHDREGNLWFAQVGGVSKLRPNFRAFRNYTPTSHQGESPLLPAPSVGAVVPVTDSGSPCRVWAATSGGGIACLGDRGQGIHLGSADGLYGDYLNALAVDDSHGLWIGTTRGIQRLSFGPEQQGAGRPVDVQGRLGRLTDYDRSSVFSISVIPLDAGQPASSPIESIWFTHDGRIQVRMPGAWYSLSADAGLPRDRLHAVATDASGHIWVATRSKGIYRSVRPITVGVLAHALSHPMPPSPSEDLVTEVAVPLFEPAWSTATGAPTNETYGMVWHDRLMWVATASGVVALSADPVRTVAHLTSKEGLRDNFSMSLALAPATGTLWVGTNGGLAEIAPGSREVLRTVVKKDGLVDSEVWYIGSVRIGEDGTVLFGNAKGLAEYRPALDESSTVPPLLEMRNVDFAEDNWRNEINVEYAALTYVNESNVRYQTRLVGYEADWSAEKSIGRIRYTNLSAVFLPRTYTFEVRASNGEGVWTPTPLAYSFSVQPPLWLRWWAVLLYTLGLAGGVLGVHRYQRARLIKRERERSRLREAELATEAAHARSQAAEAEAKALASENKRNEVELAKARELEKAYSLVQRKNEESEKLLLNILPASVADRLKGGEIEIADSYDQVTILFSDVVGFTKLASRMPASELVHHLNLLFSEFDRLAIDSGIEKIKTIGDAYMAVAGLPEPRPDHAYATANLALAMIDAVDRLSSTTGLPLRLRIGAHSGPVTAGVIGKHKFAYDVWGDAVNTAARMESYGVPGRVHVSADTRALIQDGFELEARDSIDVKGKGRMNTYLIERRRTDTPGSGVDIDAASSGSA